MTNIELRTRGMYDSLSNSGKKVADYFLSNIDDVFNLAIADLAKKSGVSKAAWVRFSKTIGYDGLKDLKKALFIELHKNTDEDLPATPFSDIGDAESIEDLIQSAKSNSIRAIESTASLLDAKEVETAAQKILCSKTVRIFGMGASALVGEDLQSKLMRINKNVFFSADTHVQLVYASNMTPRDVAVLISMSGSTTEILEIMKIARECGTPIIALTKFGKSPLAQSADVVLNVSAPEIALRSGAMSSRIAQLMAVDVLFSAVAFLDYDRVTVNLEKSHNSTQPHHQR